jgi:PAS domain S-box-containing protein
MKSTVERVDIEELLKILGDEAPVGICIMQDGKFCYFNSNFPIAIGYTVDELVGKDSLEIVVPEDREMVRENTIKMLKGKVTSPYQFRVIHKDGSIVWIMATVKSTQYHGRRATLGSYMEVTERKQMEEALKENEEKYRELANSITDVFFAMDEHLRYTYWNKASEILTGIRAEDAIGKPLREIFPDTPGVRRAEKMYRKVLKTRQPQTFVNDYDTDGRHYILEISAYPSRDGISVFVKDITEHKQAEEKLKESEQKYRTILEEMGDGYFETDLAGNLTFINDALIRILGYSKEEIIGMNFRAIRPKEHLKAIFEASNRMYKTGEPLRDRLAEVICKDGRHAFAETAAFPIRNDKGEIIGFRGIHRDITDRKQAEEKLRQSEEKHRALFDSSVIGMFVMDAETMKIVMCNQAAAKMFGFSSVEEAIGVNPLDFVHPEDKDKALEITIKEMFEQDLRRTHEYRVVNKDGREGWTSVTGARIMHEGRLAGLVSIIDITERKQAVEALRQSEERYRTILEEMEDAYSEVDFGGHLTFVNNSVCRDLGYSREELMGMSYKGFTVEDDIESVFRAFNEVYRTGVPNKGFPWKTIRKDGTHGFAETSVSPLRNDKGEIIGFRSVGRDITERKQTEEKLRQSRERYRALFDSSVTGTLVVDAETMKVLIGNQAAVKMFGFSSAKEGAGANLLDFVPPEEREKNLELLMKELFEQDSRRTFDLRVVTKDGRKIWISATGARIMHGGRLAGLLSFTDITERKKMEEALNLQRAYFQQLFDNSPDAIVMLDINESLSHANRGFEALFGYSTEELKGQSIRQLIVPEEDKQATSASLQKVFNGEVVRRETVRRRKDSSLVDVSTLSYPIRLNDKVVGACFTYTDITQRKKAEAALQQSEENYRTLFDSSVIGMYVMDAETMKVVMGNRASREMVGLKSEQEGIGVNPFDFVVPEDREKVLEIAINEFLQDSRRTHEVRIMDKKGRRGWQSFSIAKIMHAAKIFGFSSVEEVLGLDPFAFVLREDREGYLEIAQKAIFEQNSHEPFEIRAVGKDGRERWINTTATVIMHKGRLTGLISFADITEQKRQREQLMMTDRLASLGELASGTAHELNNPLTSIIGFSQLLMEREVPDDIREDLKLINNEAQRAASVTKNLLTFARKHAPEKQPTQINNIIEDVLKLRAYEHKADSIEVVRQFAPDLPEIMVDYFQMQQVFINIIINAEHFMVEGHKRGALTITTKKQNDTVMISFADDGPGIPPENLRRIFDPFFTTKEAGRGTGLGLSICHGIVTEHGGQIYAKSQSGKGATFVVELPINSH